MSAVLLALFRQIVGDDAASSVSPCSCVVVSFVSSDSGGGVLQTFAWLILINLYTITVVVVPVC
jgi:hypothetical protein